ncbi:hypothetical protein [Sinorhizobium medicae]
MSAATESGDFCYDREIWGPTPAQTALRHPQISATRFVKDPDAVNADPWEGLCLCSTGTHAS